MLQVVILSDFHSPSGKTKGLKKICNNLKLLFERHKIFQLICFNADSFRISSFLLTYSPAQQNCLPKF